MIEITAQFYDDQAELLKSMIGQPILINRATLEAMYFGRVVVKMQIIPQPDLADALENAKNILPGLLADSKICMEWEKLTGSRNPLEYLSTRAAKEWPVKGDEKQ